MGFLSKIFGKNETVETVGGMQDYMTLIRVYFQAAIAAQVGITNIGMLPDLRVFKTTFKVPTEHNKLGVGEKSRCRKMLKEMYGHDDAFFKLRIPSFFKSVIRTATEKTVGEVFTSNNFSDPATLKAVASVRKYNARLNFSQQWVTDFVYQVVMLAKKEKQPAEQG